MTTDLTFLPFVEVFAFIAKTISKVSAYCLTYRGESGLDLNSIVVGNINMHSSVTKELNVPSDGEDEGITRSLALFFYRI